MTTSVRVPVPVAVAVLLALVLSAALAMRRPSAPPETAGTSAAPAPIQAAGRFDAPVVTRTSLAGFQPVSEMTVTVVKETHQ